MTAPDHVREEWVDERIQIVLDDATVERLLEAAKARGVELDRLLSDLLLRATDCVDDLLGPAPRKRRRPRG
jgi:hypothetical protein